MAVTYSIILIIFFILFFVKFYYVDKDVLLINKTASLILDRGYNVIYDDNDIKIGNWIVKE